MRHCIAFLLMMICPAGTLFAGHHQWTVSTKPGAVIQPTMYGIFFEDINYGADGGLYAELVQNRSFEAPLHITPQGERISGGLQGWTVFGYVTLCDEHPAFARNPHYVRLHAGGHPDKQIGLENHGYFGMGLKKGVDALFSVYARTNGGEQSQIRVELVDSHNRVMTAQHISIKGQQWTKYTTALPVAYTEAKGFVRIFLEGSSSVDLDHVSLFPADAWKGLLRADLVAALRDLHPGVFRFPGGCIVEGTDLATRYQWKNSVGMVEDRPMNENRWNTTFVHRLSPSYYQSYGLGFYELFLLSEEIGAAPLPVVSVGLACQYQNRAADSARVHVAVDNLQPYIDDARDLIEFANGGTDTRWGKLRADMGHPEPFHLQVIGVGNEQWGSLYPARLERFVKAIRAKYPDIKIVGSSGPEPDDKGGKLFTYGWEQMRRLRVDLVDEHYYKDPEWFIGAVTRYDNYSRKGPKVFAGEYACHTTERDALKPENKNNFEAALYEAALMTGLERNADVVHMATYAPLFAHVEGWQWRPDLIWFDNLSSVRTPNWYVQQLYATHRGTNVLTLKNEAGSAVTGQEGLCASAVYDKTENSYIVKVVNVSNDSQDITLTFKGVKTLGDGIATLLHHDDLAAFNAVSHQRTVVPQSTTVKTAGNRLTVTVPAKTFAVYTLPLKK